MRRVYLAATLGITLAFMGQASAQERPSIPTPGPDQIVFTGDVPVPAATLITLRAFDLDTAHAVVCDEAESTVGSEDSPETSQYILLFEAACFEGAEGAFICWDLGPVYEDCELVAASALAIEQYDLRTLHGPQLASFDQLGQIVNTGLLSIPVPTEPPNPPETGGGTESPVALELPDTGATTDESGAAIASIWPALAALGGGFALIAAGILVARRP